MQIDKDRSRLSGALDALALMAFIAAMLAVLFF